jgi:hypothetical protein
MMRVTRIRKPSSFRPVTLVPYLILTGVYFVADLSKASHAHRLRCVFVFAVIASVLYLFFVLLRLID